MFFNHLFNYYMPYNTFFNQINLFQLRLFNNNYYNNYYNKYNNYYNNYESVFQQIPTEYNRSKGELILANAKESLPDKEPNPPICAKYVKNAIVKSGFGEYVRGNGEQTKYMLRNNLNFREIKVNREDLVDLPEGTILVYDANEPVTYLDGTTGEINKYGHVTVKDYGDNAVSDRKEKLPLSDKAHVFIPV